MLCKISGNLKNNNNNIFISLVVFTGKTNLKNFKQTGDCKFQFKPLVAAVVSMLLLSLSLSLSDHHVDNL